MNYDLHIHSEFSDGKINGSHILEVEKLFDYWVITDHENIAFHQIYNSGHNRRKNLGIGAELTVLDPENNNVLHLLIYAKELSDELVFSVKEFTDWRNQMVETGLYNLVDILKIPNIPSLVKIPNGCYSTLQFESIVSQYGYSFFEFIKQYEIFPSNYKNLKETIERFRKIPEIKIIVAHPREKDMSKIVIDYLKQGLIDGLEINLSKNNQGLIKNYEGICEFVTTGSDSHEIPTKLLRATSIPLAKRTNTKINNFIKWIRD